MSLSDAEANLAQLASRGQWDHSLDRLLKMSEGAGTSVSLVVNGLFFYGDLAPPRAWAKRFDQGIERGLREAEERMIVQGEDTEPSAPIFEAIRSNPLAETVEAAWRERVELPKEIEAATDGDPDWEVGDLPDDLGRRAILDAAPYPVVTLRNAEIAVPGGPTAEVGTIRVLTHHVAAWWLGRPGPSR